MSDVAFAQQALEFVAERLLEPALCHHQHPICYFFQVGNKGPKTMLENKITVVSLH